MKPVLQNVCRETRLVSLLTAPTDSHLFFCGRFLIGREKEGVESEVARLINESLEMDKTSGKVCFLKEEMSLFLSR